MGSLYLIVQTHRKRKKLAAGLFGTIAYVRTPGVEKMLKEHIKNHRDRSGECADRHKRRTISTMQESERIKRFERFLENRGCPTRLVYHAANEKIDWID